VSTPRPSNEPSPEGERASERELLVRDMRAAIGSSIARVNYLEPDNAPVELYRCPGFDEANVGVEIETLAGTTFSAVWQMSGYSEALSFGPGTGESRHGLYPLHRSDVSQSPAWRPLLGRTVTDVGIGWHIPNEGSPETVWSVRLAFDAGTGVLFALGRATADCSIEYLPDEVVVVMDDRLGRGYTSPAQTTSAYDP
jgi:hypothetical protein